MKALNRYFAGAAGAAALALTAASPAQAQSWDRYHDRGGIDAGDVIAGVAVIGGIAAIVSALSRDGDRYGYANRSRYRNDYRGAVNACAVQAERYSRGGRVRITDIDRRGANRYRVAGVIDAAYGYNRGYGRNDRFGRYDQRVAFACNARANGRITGFDIGRG